MVRYVTRAGARLETRNKLFGKVVELMQEARRRRLRRATKVSGVGADRLTACDTGKSAWVLQRSGRRFQRWDLDAPRWGGEYRGGSRWRR